MPRHHWIVESANPSDRRRNIARCRRCGLLRSFEARTYSADGGQTWSARGYRECAAQDRQAPTGPLTITRAGAMLEE